MERYSEYKDSGVKWLGEIPSHWNVFPLKYVVSYNDEALLESENKNKRIKYVEIGDVDGAFGIKKYTEYEFKDAPSRARRITRRGDVIISTVRTYLRAVAPINDDGFIVSTGFAVLRAKKIEKRFLAYYVMSSNFIDEVVRKSVGTSYPAINANDLVSIDVVSPSLSEQVTIANYLDSVIAKIDEAIAQQQKMIDLLNERKQIIINKAVTKGLDPKAKMKDSGIDWIGHIPEHWEISVFKHLFNTRTGITFTKEQLSESGAPVISYGQIHSKDNWGASINPILIRHIPQSLTKGKDSAIAIKGDFLFADTSEDFEGCGNNVYVDTEEPVYAGYHTILAKCNNKECGQYLAYLFASSKWRGQVRSMVNGVKVYSVTQTILNDALVILPPISEQKEIANYVTKKVVVINEAIDRCKKRIKLLQERKQIIINDVITGKVKVV